MNNFGLNHKINVSIKDYLLTFIMFYFVVLFDYIIHFRKKISTWYSIYNECFKESHLGFNDKQISQVMTQCHLKKILALMRLFETVEIEKKKHIFNIKPI